MNERIREIAREAGIYIVSEPFDDAAQSWNDNMEKFAESIVRECMRMCDVAEHAYITHNLDVQSQGCQMAKELIADWFEVEE